MGKTLQNVIASITDRCRCEQDIARLRSANPSRYTGCPGSLGLTLDQISSTTTLGALALVKMCVFVDMAMGNELLVFLRMSIDVVVDKHFSLIIGVARRCQKISQDNFIAPTPKTFRFLLDIAQLQTSIR